MSSYVPLADVAQINPRLPKGVDESQEVSFLAMASVSEEGRLINQETRILNETKKGYTYFQRGDILLAKITPCFENGKAALVDNLEHSIGFGSTEFHVLRPIPQRLDAKYLFYIVWSNRFRYLGQKVMKGAAGQKRVPANFLKSFEIFLPPLDDQKRIAHVLGKVEGLIAQRKHHLQQLDDLLKSIFFEMFGDPVRNEKGWDKKPLSRLGELNRGVSKHRPRNAPELLGGKYPLIQTGDVANSGTYITTYTQTYSELGLKQSKLWPAKTLCITIAANIAQTGILTFDACFPDSVVSFQAYEAESNTLYVLGLFWFFQRILEKNAPAAAQRNINLKILRELDVPAPPPKLQNHFATIVEKVEGIKSRYQQSLTNLENLYGALSQKAFKGELNLSRIPLPSEDTDITAAKPSETSEAPPPTETFNLPAPPEQLTTLHSTEGRCALIDQWLAAWLAHLNNESFSTQVFMEAAQQRLWELAEELEKNAEEPEENAEELRVMELGATEYDHLKAWLFESLKIGHLAQSYDDANNCVLVKAADN